MTTPQLTLIGLLGLVLVLLAWGRWRYDVVAFGALLAAVVLDLVPAAGAFDGFGHPATVTVALVLVISRALAVAGTTELLARLVAPVGEAPRLYTAALSGIGAATSGFMNNIGTLGLLMPVALRSAARAGHSASAILMPLSFACILGGLITLIGTPPNIIVAAYRAGETGTAFAMFDYTPVGFAIAVTGVAFVTLVGHRLVPARRAAGDDEDLFEIDSYITELEVADGSAAAGRTVREVEEAAGDAELRVIDLVRGERHLAAVRPTEALRAGDVLVVEADSEAIDRIVAALELELVDAGGGRKVLTDTEDAELIEAVVMARTMIDGRTVESLRFPRRFGVNLIAVSRQGRPHHGRLGHFRFRPGDVVLLHGEREQVHDAVATLGCLPLRERALQFGRRASALLPAALFALAIALAAGGVLALPVALGCAAAAMVVGGSLPLRELYSGIDWPVIVLLGALIPVGGALQTTGATGVLAGWILEITAAWPALAVLALVLAVTMTLSDVLNNAATAVIMAPLAMDIAERLGSNPDAFLMAVAVGASCAFLTPIGHQNNALVMGPGGYRFGDFWRLGLPLELLVLAVAVPAIDLVWGL